jgi:hypothetical protein
MMLMLPFLQYNTQRCCPQCTTVHDIALYSYDLYSTQKQWHRSPCFSSWTSWYRMIKKGQLIATQMAAEAGCSKRTKECADERLPGNVCVLISS